MSEDLDELFGGGTGQAQPRYLLIWSLLLGGTFTAFVGLLCNAAPGGVMVMLSWTVLETELDRVDSGYLALSERSRLVAIQRLTQVCLVLVIAIFAVQMFLYCNGGYEVLWGNMLSWLVLAFDGWTTTAAN